MNEEVEEFSIERARYLLPPRPLGPAGGTRKLGMEVEFAGVSLADAARATADALGSVATIHEDTLEAEVDSTWGPVRLELDAPQVRERRYLAPLESLGIASDSKTSQFIDDAVRSVASELVPLEVVAPPIPWNELSAFDPVWKALHEAGAQGTHASALHAFGLHLNPEVDGLSVDRALATLQAYLLLEDWLMRSMYIDPTRQIVPFIRGYPEAYRRQVLTRGYRPDWEQFIRDYAEHNPTRNRRVDLWPLIRHLTGEEHADRVRDWQLVKARPTYHYRLPNCEISDPDWTPALACNGWVMVERLSHADETRFELAQTYLEMGDLPLRMQKLAWIEWIAGRLHRLTEAGDRAAS